MSAHNEGPGGCVPWEDYMRLYRENSSLRNALSGCVDPYRQLGPASRSRAVQEGIDVLDTLVEDAAVPLPRQEASTASSDAQTARDLTKEDR